MVLLETDENTDRMAPVLYLHWIKKGREIFPGPLMISLPQLQYLTTGA
jgi:hypothetical protein